MWVKSKGSDKSAQVGSLARALPARIIIQGTEIDEESVMIYEMLFEEFQIVCYLGDNCIHNFHFGRYIMGYTVGNLV